MQRKIIQQSATSKGISLPSKWIKQWHLKKGQEVEVIEEENKLVITPRKEHTVKEVTLTITDTSDSGIRTILVNAYRAGYDCIQIIYKGKKELLSTITDTQLLGFELFTKKPGQYTIESVAEPALEDFEKIIIKQMQIIQEILNNLNKDVKKHVYRVRKYDNFLKRCLSKLIIPNKGFLWQFLSGLTHIANQSYHLQLDTQRITSQEQLFVKDIILMFQLLQKGYAQKDMKQLLELHNIERKKVFSKGKKLLQGKRPIVAHHLLSIARLVYLASSPLAGMIQTKESSSGKTSD